MDDQEKRDSHGDKFDITLVEKKTDFNRKERKVQRYAAALMLLFLLAGLLGFFGGGVVSKTKISLNGFEVKYQQYLRENTPSRLVIYLSGDTDSTTVSFNKKYIEGVKIGQIMPQPVSSKTSDGRIFYTFNTARQGMLVFYLTPDKPGSVELELGVQGEVKSLEQYVHY